MRQESAHRLRPRKSVGATTGLRPASVPGLLHYQHIPPPAQPLLACASMPQSWASTAATSRSPPHTEQLQSWR